MTSRPSSCERATIDAAIEAISAFVTRKSIRYPPEQVEKGFRFTHLGTSRGHR